MFSASNIILLVFLAVAGFFLVTEHRAHVIGVLPWLLVLACPLMHLFHGRRHRHGRHGDGHADSHAGCCGGEPRRASGMDTRGAHTHEKETLQ